MLWSEWFFLAYAHTLIQNGAHKTVAIKRINPRTCNARSTRSSSYHQRQLSNPASLFVVISLSLPSSALLPLARPAAAVAAAAAAQAYRCHRAMRKQCRQWCTSRRQTSGNPKWDWHLEGRELRVTALHEKPAEYIKAAKCMSAFICYIRTRANDSNGCSISCSLLRVRLPGSDN